jgi:hypothetical protein
LQVENTANEGARLLRAYLEYAFAVSQQGFHANQIWNAATRPASAPTLAQRLQAADERLRPGYPFADLIAVDTGEHPTEMIMTDDLTLYRAVSARSVFVYQPLHFTRKLWQYRYVFSRNWWKNN